ncbi:MAG: CBS domain-containing protein [Polyangiaceae bacterium]
MNPSAMTVSLLMTSPVVSVTPETSLDVAYRMFLDRRVSCVPVIDKDGRALGVLSDTDLLRVGRLQPASLAGVQALELPNEPVGQHMHAGIITVVEDTPVESAARTLVDKHIHRVFVQRDGAIAGVFSTEEVLVAIREKRIGTPIFELMTTPVHTVPMSASLAEAAARLDRAHMSGLAVVDDHDHPVGVFTKTEALKARDRSTSTKVEEVMSYAMLSQNGRTPVFRAAAHAYETSTRRVFVMEDRKLAGVLTGLDFARILASSAK